MLSEARVISNPASPPARETARRPFPASWGRVLAPVKQSARGRQVRSSVIKVRGMITEDHLCPDLGDLP